MILHSIFSNSQATFYFAFPCRLYLPARSFFVDISAQANLTVRHYCETTPVAERTAIVIWNVMTKAQERTIKSIRARTFEKYISVAHPDNGEDLFHEVSLFHFHVFVDMDTPFICVPSLIHFIFFERAQIIRHFNKFALTDMIIEKLQKIVTCPVEASFKAKLSQPLLAPLAILPIFLSSKGYEH